MLLAHGVGSVYELPLPLYAYLGGSAVTVLASFVVRAIARRTRARGMRIGGARTSAIIVGGFRALAIALLFLSIPLAIADPAVNSPAAFLFWVGLVVATTFLSSAIGGLWARGSPWLVLEGLYHEDMKQRGDFPPPWWLGPLLLYLLFWFELVSGWGFHPIATTLALLLYTAFFLGLRPRYHDRWETVDPFWILFGFASRIAPVYVDTDGLYYRGPVAALDEPRPMPLSLYTSVFVLLGATTLDNVTETTAWGDLLTRSGLDAIPSVLVETVALALFALPFLGSFLAVVWVARRWIPGDAPIERSFGWSLIPIGIAYVLAHNAPLLISQGPRVIGDIAGIGGAELFGAYLPSPKLVWFLEIGLIVGGHVLGVLAAHRIAERLSGSHEAALRSHIALTVLMTGFTITTLWLLSLAVVN